MVGTLRAGPEGGPEFAGAIDVEVGIDGCDGLQYSEMVVMHHAGDLIALG